MTFKELLKANDMSASRLARTIGVRTETVCHWVRGRSVPNVIMERAISKALGVPIHVVNAAFSPIPQGDEKKPKGVKKCLM